MRASCKKYSPRKSIMECDINSILGERWCAENKSPLFLLKLALKLRAEKKSQLFLKWWLSTYADAGIHNTAWKNISGPEHHFPFFFSFFFSRQTFVLEGKWVTAEPDQDTATKITPRREKKKKKEAVRSLRGTNRVRIEHPRAVHQHVLSGCFLSSSPPPARRLETAAESLARCFAHSDPRVSPRCDPQLPGGPAGDAQPSSFKKSNLDQSWNRTT